MSKRSSLGTHDDGDPLTNDAMERLDKVRYEFKEPDKKKSDDGLLLLSCIF